MDTIFKRPGFPFLKENKFLAGVSLDGDAACHDDLRRDAKGKGTYKHVMKTITLLKRYGIDFNVLAVVTGYSAGHAQRLYQFFSKSMVCIISSILNVLTP